MDLRCQAASRWALPQISSLVQPAESTKVPFFHAHLMTNQIDL